MSAETIPPVEPEESSVGRRRRKDVGALLGALWLGFIVITSITAAWLPLPNPDAVGGVFAQAPFQDFGHLLGTDSLGRDQLSRAIYGARISLAVGVGATVMAMTAGLIIGMLAGYFRGLVDSVSDIFTNVLLAFPPVILLIAMVAVFPRNALTLTIGLAIVGTSTFTRIARANAIAFARREFVTASRSLGASHLRVMIRELLPNVMLPMMSFSLLVAAALIVAEGSLSFIGLGVPPPAPSWGGMIAAGRDRLSDQPQLVLVPATFFFLTVLSLNRLGDWARGQFGKESSL
jgi:peptide/nickel transport system permease protein